MRNTAASPDSLGISETSRGTQVTTYSVHNDTHFATQRQAKMPKPPGLSTRALVSTVQLSSKCGRYFMGTHHSRSSELPQTNGLVVL